jgi:hypothetical protein
MTSSFSSSRRSLAVRSMVLEARLVVVLTEEQAQELPAEVTLAQAMEVRPEAVGLVQAVWLPLGGLELSAPVSLDPC